MNSYKVITIENLAEASAQEVFDHIVNHLVTQGDKSYGTDKCRNRWVKADGTLLK